jgi:hypothetical protein
MLSLDKKLSVFLYEPKRFEYDLDFILAASTIYDDLTVTLTQNMKNYINAHKIYSKQFSALPEFGVHTVLSEKPPSPVLDITIADPNLINYDELVDLVEEFGATHTWY